MTETAIFKDGDADSAFRAKWFANRLVVYGVLILWAFICLFPIYWTITTSFKMAPNVMQGNLIPWVDYQPKWLGWKSLGLSPDTIGTESTVREEFMKRFMNSAIVSLASSALAVVLGALAAYGLSRFTYKFAWMKNDDISFFFLSQLILPPVVLALPFLVLYKELGAARHPDRADPALYPVGPAYRDLDHEGPVCLHPNRVGGGGDGGRAGRLGGVPDDHPAHRFARHGGGVYPVPRADVERVFLCGPADLDPCQYLAGHGGQSDRQSGDFVVVHGGPVGGGDPAADRDRGGVGAVHHQGDGGGGGEVMSTRGQISCVN
jgi:hypothetical protein